MNKVLFEVSYIGNGYAFCHVIIFFCVLCCLLFGDRRIIKTSRKEGEVRIGTTGMRASIVILAVYMIVLLKGYIGTVVQYKTGDCQTRKNGGVIVGNGQHLRIRYIRNGKEKVIVYIEQMIPAADSGE